MSGKMNSETTGRDNCGHDPGLTTEAPAEKPLQAEGGERKPGHSRNSTQKAMHENLMEEVISRENATRAWEAVKRNQGAPGIDRMTTGELREHIRKHWEGLTAKLLTGTYVPAPVKRVEIPKPNGGNRMLGIPMVEMEYRWASIGIKIRVEISRFITTCCGTTCKLTITLKPGTHVPPPAFTITALHQRTCIVLIKSSSMRRTRNRHWTS
jgi:hypothetical protein